MGEVEEVLGKYFAFAFAKMAEQMGWHIESLYWLFGALLVAVLLRESLQAARDLYYAPFGKKSFRMVWQVNSHFIVPSFFAIALLVVAAAGRWPPAAYVILHLAIAMLSAYVAQRCHHYEWKFATWSFAGCALLYNPLVPVRLHRADWDWINIATALFWACFVFVSFHACWLTARSALTADYAMLLAPATPPERPRSKGRRRSPAPH